MRYCAHQGCHQLVARGSCRTHRPGPPVAPTAPGDVFLPPARYNRLWRLRKAAFLAAHPFCVDCVAERVPLGLATDVDHEVPHRGDPALFWDEANWRPRCHSHHSRKTAYEVGLSETRTRRLARDRV